MPDQTKSAGPLRPTNSPRFTLGELGLVSDASDHDRLITGITLDSRNVTTGDLYVALPGTHTHGARFATSAVAAGAAAILTDHEGQTLIDEVDVPVIATEEPRVTMARVASVLFGHPTEDLVTFGVTGTNGKTTTVCLLDAALRAAGRRSGTIGTMGFTIDGRQLGGTRTTVTTPESVDLQALFAVLAESGADHVAMEVSSHALSLHRVDQVAFDAVGFTNLGRDHLDFHATMADYFAAKARLFTTKFSDTAVIVIDDEAGRELASSARELGLKVRTVSVQDPTADYRVQAQARNDGGWELRIDTPSGSYPAHLALPGAHNLANALLAAGLLDVVGLDLAECLPGFATVEVPGRMQRVRLAGAAPAVYVDFAHTPQAVAATLRAFTERTGKLIAVLGCGGDRDMAKREPMGRAAADLADIVVVTDDNPRTEPAEAIRAQVLAGARQGAARVLDGGVRSQAIRSALALAGPEDIVAVLGKGHERGQEINGELFPFDDVTEVTTAWQERA